MRRFLSILCFCLASASSTDAKQLDRYDSEEIIAKGDVIHVQEEEKRLIAIFMRYRNSVYLCYLGFHKDNAIPQCYDTDQQL